METTTTKKTQLRAICSACFRLHALRGARVLVQHGYERPEGWHENVGTCRGTGRPHFGTPEGRDEAARIAVSLREYAVRRVAEAENATSVFVRKSAWSYAMVEVKAGESRFEEAFGINLRRAKADSASAVSRAEYIDSAVSSWKPVFPVEVEVEEKVAIIHGYAKGKGKMCAGSYNAARKGSYTSNWELVTCPKCLALRARFAAQRAAA